jgi:protein-disulfide isomerase
MPIRRLVLIAALALATAPAVAAPAKPPAKAAKKPPAASTDMSLGSPKAKVQVVEYASLSCPHCARFNNDVFPAFKAKYVDTGQVRYTLREMLTPPAQIAAAGFLMARCAGPERYFDVVDAVFKSQPRWTDDGADVKAIFVGVAKDNGLTEEQFEACLKNEAGLTALQARVKSAVAEGVDSTPTFVINGKKYEGEMSLEELDAAVAEAGKTKKGG